MEIILDNGFTQDTLGRRGVRLIEIQHNIEELQPTLNIPDDLFNWAKNSSDIFESARVIADTELGEKEGATTELDEKEKIMRETFTDIRSIILARYTGYAPHLDDFNLDLDFPDKTNDRMIKVLDVVTVSDRHRAAGVPCVLPEETIDRLRTVVEDVRTAYQTQDIEKYESKHAHRVLWDIYDADSAKLAELQGWAKVMWGRYDVRFELIGMVPVKKQTVGGDVPAIPIGFEYKWLDPVLKLEWKAVEGATSYQLAYRKTAEEAWEELYSGAEKEFEFEPAPGGTFYRVRARNADGYGDWSVTLQHEVEGEAPVGEWPNELIGLYAAFRTLPSILIEVGFNAQGGADWYNLKRMKVALGDPDPTDASMPQDNYVEELPSGPYADTDIVPGDKCAYWACGVQGGVEGNWTGPVIAEYPE